MPTIPTTPVTVLDKAEIIVTKLAVRPELFYLVAKLMVEDHSVAGPWVEENNQFARHAPDGEVLIWVERANFTEDEGWLWSTPDNEGVEPTKTEAMEAVDADLYDSGWILVD